ncbi:MAG: thioredoxin [bacterium]
MQETITDFQKEVIEASKNIPIVVDFWAEWCAPCRTLAPVLEKLAAQANGKWKLVKVNTEEHPQIAMQCGIQGIPAVKMFYNGEVTAEFVGALPQIQVKRWLDENIPTESKKILQEAKQALSKGDKKRAQKLLQQAIEEDNNNFEAKILLAGLIFESEPEKSFNLVENAPEEHPLFENAEAIRTLYRLQSSYESLSQTATQSGSAREAWDLYLRGIQALRQHNYEASLKNWIEVLSLNREIDDDGPRRACVALFTWLGHDHELTKKYHRTFTSALF